MRCRFSTLPILFLLASSPISAATISVTAFSDVAYNAAISGSNIVAEEDFESSMVGNIADGYLSNVGNFYSAGGIGSGGTISNASFNNDGSLLAIRNGYVFGRTSTTPTLTNNQNDDQFLDSNDTYGIEWQVSAGGSLFDRLVLTITDASEFKNMVIEIDSMTYSLGDLGNGVSLLLQIDLDSQVTAQTVLFRHFNNNNHLAINDGFSLDDITVSAVPLPASVFLLTAALASLGFTRQRQ